MARSNVPPFGNWDAEEDISYTTSFENARRPSSSERANPNRSPVNPNMIPKQETLKRLESPRGKHERKISLDEGDLQRQGDGVRRASRDTNLQTSVGMSGSTPKRGPRPNGASLRSADQSPMHPHYQAKIPSKGSTISSPSWERKGSCEGSQGLAPSTPGRSRLKSVPRGNETPERGTAVPKFGEWDETDPSSADGFSHIFSKVKEERHGSVGNAPGGATQTHHSNVQKRHTSKDSKV
ncbi:hypothetical protein RND81_12G031200 [Saponaria officinalis]|uniref:RIN4 pathogenic type III effector avirulence factor Avr cleavage site domain-containing protein n=1 Tax=Saponaria officinalis TaxID=3572 RepID=A0AAW1H770_SAPOF